MSTVICDAYRIKETNAEIIESINMKITEFMKLEIGNSINKLIAESFLDYRFYLMDHPDKSYWDAYDDINLISGGHDTGIFKEFLRGKYTTPNFYHMHLHMIEEASSMNLNVTYNQRSTFYFKTVKGYTYYVLKGCGHINKLFREKYKTICGNDFKTYDYWNNTDGPSNISRKNWEQRSDDWDSVISRSYNEMNQKVILPISYEVNSPEKMSNFIPNDFSLLRRYFKTKMSDIYFIEELERQQQAGESKNNSRAMKYTKTKIEEEFDSGRALDKFEYLKSVKFTHLDLLNSILFDKTSYPEKI